MAGMWQLCGVTWQVRGSYKASHGSVTRDVHVTVGDETQPFHCLGSHVAPPIWHQRLAMQTCRPVQLATPGHEGITDTHPEHI